jgi:hypothetical protein
LSENRLAKYFETETSSNKNSSGRRNRNFFTINNSLSSCPGGVFAPVRRFNKCEILPSIEVTRFRMAPSQKSRVPG